MVDERRRHGARRRKKDERGLGMKTALTVSIVTILLISPPVAGQDINTGRFIDAPVDLDMAYLAGLYSGMAWYRAEAQRVTDYSAFCPPDKIALQLNQIKDIVTRFVATHPENRDRPLGLTLRLALTDAFPCKRP